VLRKKEQKAFGEFMSKRKCLEEYDRIQTIMNMVIELAPHKLYFHNLCMLSANGRKVDLPRSVY
jgi:hypothetical protein